MVDKKIHRWALVVLCMVGVSTGPGAFLLGSLGLVLGDLETEFGWTRAGVSAAVSAMMIATAATTPFIGALIDRFGVRAVLIPSVLSVGLLMIAVTQVTSLWQFIVIYTAMGVLGAGAGSVGFLRLLAGWFDRSRGLAIGIAGSGTGLGFAYVPLLAERAVDAWGWRGTYFMLAAIVLCVTLPMIVLALKPDPALAEPSDGETAKAEETGLTLSQAARSRDFWAMLATFVVVACVLYGVIPHLVPMLEGRGFATAAAAGVASIFGLATFGGRVLIGWLVDRFEARRVAAVFFGLSAIGMALLAVPLPMWAVLLSALLLGGSLGAEVDMLALLVSRYFGLRCFARIFGTLFSAVMVAMSIGPVLFGVVFDRTGSYALVMAAGIPACLIAMVTISLLSPRPIGRERALRAAVTEPAA